MRQNTMNAAPSVLRKLAWLALPLAALIARGAAASRKLCDCCGHEEACQRVCRLVWEERKVETVIWGVQCEEFCIPGPNTPGHYHVEVADAQVLQKDAVENVRARPVYFAWTLWLPGTARPYTKKKLMKKTIVTKVPGFRWVVEDRCAQCAAQLEREESPMRR